MKPKINREQWEQIDSLDTSEKIGGFIWGFFGLGGMWFLAVSSWGVATGTGMKPVLIAAAIVGLIFGLLAGGAISSNKSRVRAHASSGGATMMYMMITVPAILLAAVVWIVRQVI